MFFLDRIILILLLIFIQGCIESEYSGDGQLIDSGVTAANYRYILDLGEINLSKQGSYNYNLNNLPEGDYFIGFFIEIDKVIYIEPKKVNNAYLSFKLEDNIGNVIKEDSFFINDWLWSWGRDGKPTISIFIYSKSSSEFKAHANSHYKINLVVKEPNTVSNTNIRLQLKASGWK